MIEVLNTKNENESMVNDFAHLRSLIKKEYRRQAFVKSLGNDIVSDRDRNEFRIDCNMWLIRQELAMALASGKRPTFAYLGESILR
jgi:hypothetical protein